MRGAKRCGLAASMVTQSRVLLAFLYLPLGALVACQSPSNDTKVQSAFDAAERERVTFVQAACGGCHSVQHASLSPNPSAPSFASIANRPGVTKRLAVRWLSYAHNYPEEMDFDLDEAQVDMVATHLMSLRHENYRPIPQ